MLILLPTFENFYVKYKFFLHTLKIQSQLKTKQNQKAHMTKFFKV